MEMNKMLKLLDPVKRLCESICCSPNISSGIATVIFEFLKFDSSIRFAQSNA